LKTLNVEIEPKNMIKKYEINSYIFYSICYVRSKIQILGQFNKCKEVFLYTVAENYLKGENLENLKLIINTPKDFEIKAKRVIETIDMFSTVNKWGKSIIYKINTLISNFYIIDLPKQWFKFPQLISLIMLIISSCHIFDIKYNDVKSFIDAIIEKKLPKNNYQSIFYFPRNWMLNILLILNNYEYLFKNEDPSYLYDWEKCANIDSNKYITQSGIKSLCYCNSLSNTLNKKLIKLKEKK